MRKGNFLQDFFSGSLSLWLPDLLQKLCWCTKKTKFSYQILFLFFCFLSQLHNKFNLFCKRRYLSLLRLKNVHIVKMHLGIFIKLAQVPKGQKGDTNVKWIWIKSILVPSYQISFSSYFLFFKENSWKYKGWCFQNWQDQVHLYWHDYVNTALKWWLSKSFPLFWAKQTNKLWYYCVLC